MTLIGFFRIIINKLQWLVLFPAMLAIMVMYLTRNMPKEYQSSATVYTGLASGYSITDDGSEKVDYFAVNNAFDNLITTVKSRETMEEVAIKLIAQHILLKQPNKDILGEKGYEDLHKFLTMGEIAKLIVPGSFEKTVARLYSIKDSSNRNVVQFLLTDVASPYAISKISGNVTVARKSNSDMLELGYKTNDPGVCVHTLKFLIEAFSERYKNIKGSETVNVVKYFEEQLNQAFERLQGSENKLRDFGVNNKIINYNEQSKFVAESKEDLSTDFYKEKMKSEAAQNAIARIEEKMNNYSDFVSANDELMQFRQELSTLNYKITNAQIFKYDAESIGALQDQADKIKLALKEKARDYYEFNNSIEWVPQENLLNEWLNKVIELEESKGRLQVYQDRLQQYDGIYKEFAPLGSTLNRLEREVGVQEKQYLSVLHGLNLARLRQQSLEMSNQLKIVDNPYYPLNANPSKRGLLIVVSFLAGFIILLGYHVGGAILDNTIKSPERVAKMIDLPLLSAFPEHDTNNVKGIKVEEMQQSLLQQVINTLFIDLKKIDPNAKSYTIIVFSTQNAVGKSYVAESIVNKLSRIRKKVIFLHPDVGIKAGKYLDKNNPKLLRYKYKVTDGIIDYKSVMDFINLAEQAYPNMDDVSYNVIEIPRLSKYPVPANLVEQAHYSILVAHANKSWTSADNFLMNTYLKLAHGKISVILNHVAPDLLEPIYGEIPKRRSLLRKRIKSLLGGDRY
jgi:polysaccharide biosynthesis transport protein